MLVMTILKTQNLRKFLRGFSFSFGFDVSRKKDCGLSLGFQKFGQVSVSFCLNFQNFLKNRVFGFRFGFPTLPTAQNTTVNS